VRQERIFLKFVSARTRRIVTGPYPRKERPENKIDGAVALIMAIGLNKKADSSLDLGEFLANAVMR